MEGGGALRQLAVLFGIGVEGQEKLDKVDSKVEGLLGRFKKLGAVVAEGFAWEKISEFVERQVEAATELERMSIILGTTTEQLERFRFAAGEAGVSEDAMDTSLRFLNRNLGEAAEKGGESAATFARLGIQIKDTHEKTREASDVIADLADKIAETEDPAKRTQVAMDLLGRQGAQLLPVLEQGSGAFEDARKELNELGGPASRQYIESAKHVEEATHRLNVGWENLKRAAAAALFPVFEKLIDFTTRWVTRAIDFARHTTILTTGLDFLAVVAGVKTVQSLISLVKWLGFLEAEFLLPLVGLGLLYLAFDEFYNLLKGNESVIGDALDALGGLGTSAQFALDLNDALDATIDIAKDLAKIVASVLFPPIEMVYDELKGVAKAFVDIASLDPGKAWKDLKENDALAADAQRRIGQGAGAAFGDIGEALGGRVHDTAGRRRLAQQASQARQQGGAWAPGGSPALRYAAPEAWRHAYVPTFDFQAANGGRGAPGGVVIHQQNKTDVNVTTAHDNPKAIGDAVAGGVATAQQRANNNAINSPAVRKP
jgi:hypothetical protein